MDKHFKFDYVFDKHFYNKNLLLVLLNVRNAIIKYPQSKESP